MTDNFAGTSAQVLAVLMLTCVVEARLIVRAVERKPVMVSTMGNFAIYVCAGIAWIVVMIYDLVALMWCLRSLAGSPEPGADAASVLPAIGLSAASLILVPAAMVITSMILQGVKAATQAAERKTSTGSSTQRECQ
jgi:hypothetical protein